MRIHKQGGIYFTQLRGNGDVVLLESEEDRTDFETRLSAALTTSGAKIHAFCWLPNELLIAIQVGDIPLGKIVQKVTGPFAKTALARRGKSGHLFLHPHSAFLLEGEQLLLELVRYIHRAPVRAHQCMDSAEYLHSSHRAYLGQDRIPWLSTSKVLQECAARASNAAWGYRLMMEGADAADFLLRLKQSAAKHSNQSGRDQAPRNLRSLDQWVRAVGYRLRIDPALIRSQSRRRDLSLARALVASHATEDGVSLAEVARYLARDPSTLISGMDRYRESDKNLFAEELKDPPESAPPRHMLTNRQTM